jgi:subtilisin family serine protease/PKD repeat protein
VSCFYTQAQNSSTELPTELPGQIIIHYEKMDDHGARGQEISIEHKRLAEMISTRLNTPIKKVRPVFPKIVDQMIQTNQTEAELKNTKPDANRRSMAKENFNFSRSLVLNLVDNNANLKILLDRLNKEKEFEGFKIIQAEAVKLSYTTLTPNDPLYSKQWSHRITEAAKAWDTETGDAAAVICIIDTGIDMNHEDLKSNIHPKAYDFVDIDTELYRSYGYQLIAGEDYTVPDADPNDYNGHGTHVSGIAAASGNNGSGVAGVCHTCSILPVRAGFSILSGGYERGILTHENIANAIIYAADNGATVINMSFGGGGSLLMKEAIDYAHSKGVLLIAAAGNSGSNSISYPAGYDNVIAVASSDENDGRSYFSTYGNWVDVTAPGGTILSTIPKTGGSNSNPSGYSSLSGTSMASPYVAGLAGLLKAKNPNYSREDIVALIQNTCDNIDAVNPSYKSMLGSGRINVNKAINAIPGANIIVSSSVFAETSGNKNGIINSGESVSLTVGLKNTWQNANAVTATLTTADPYTTLTQSFTNFLNIPAGASKNNSTSPFTFNLSAATPDQRIVQFNLRIDYDGMVKHIPLTVQVFGTRKLEVPKSYFTIQAAINAAKNGDEVVVSPGVYFENIDFIGKRISVVSLAESTGDVNYIEKTIIDGSRPLNISQSSVVTFKNGENSHSVLSGFTIRRGNGNTGSYSGGGGIYCIMASPTLRNLIVRENTLTRGGTGGGILIVSGLANLSNITLHDNKHSASIYISQVLNPNTLTLENIHINRAIDSDGIYVSSSTIRAKEITVENCTGTVASGLMSIGSTVDIDSARITGNNRGIDVRASPRLTIRNTIVSKNGMGGGILCSNGSLLELINTTVADNKLTNHYGGAGIFITDGSSKVTSVNSIFYNNLWTEHNTGIVKPNSISFLNNGGELTVAYSDLEGGREGLKYFSGSSNVKVNWFEGNISGNPLFFRPVANDYHLTNGSPCLASGIARFEYNGKVLVDLQPYQYNGTKPNMGAYLINDPYLKAVFKADKVLGNTPFSVQFTDESYGFQTPTVSKWAWDFGDGTTASSKSPLHVYTKKGEYTVRLIASNNTYVDEEVKLAYIKVTGTDTLHVATTGSNTTGNGSRTSPYKTIQFAIDRANNDDLVLVADGTYRENINFGGRHVRVSSYYLIDQKDTHITSTIVDGGAYGRVVTFSKGENQNAGLLGLTVQNGYANGNNSSSYYGGGILIENSSPTLLDVIVKNNKANYRGGGIYINNGSPLLVHVTVSANQVVYTYGEGGGIYISQSASIIRDSKITFNSSNYNGGGLFLGYLATPDIQRVDVLNNTAVSYGGGIHIESNNLSLKTLTVQGNSAAMGGGIGSSFSNSTITYSVIGMNTATNRGGGFYYLGNSASPRLENVTVYNNSSPVGKDISMDGSAKVTISNSIIWNTTVNTIAGTAYITYSDVKGGYSGTSNINADPKLVAPYENDFSLESTSPCIDAGNPFFAKDPNGSRADMGAFYYDRPIIEGVNAAITIEEDSEKQLALADFKIKNMPPDYPMTQSGPIIYTLKLGAGANFTVTGNKVKPTSNYFGPLHVPVTISQGTVVSETYSLLITVTPVNDAPTLSGQRKLSTDEDVKLLISALDLIISDVDNIVSPSYIVNVRPGNNYQSVNNSITPAKDFYGNLSVSVTVSDGISESAPFNAVVEVTAVNDAPKIGGQKVLTLVEDNFFKLSISDLLVDDPDNESMHHSILMMPGLNYTASGDTITPEKDFNGMLTIPIKVNDGIVSSEVFHLKISVTDINDVPIITGQYTLVVEEDHELPIRISDLLYEDVDKRNEQLILRLASGENYSVSGLAIRPARDYNGQLRVVAMLEDGEEKSNPFVLNIDVTPVNDAPAIVEVTKLSMERNSMLTFLRENVTIVDPDTAPGNLTVRVLPGYDYTVSELTITPNVNFVGTLPVGMQVSDGADVSEIFYTLIEVMPITGLEDDLEYKLQVYPNPAQTFVQVEHRLQILELIMMAIDGKKYPIEQILDGEKARVDVSQLPSGTYFLCLKTKDGVTWKKIAVMR